MDTREQRGLAIAAQTKITRRNGFWIVPSSTGNGSYRVHLSPPSLAVPMCNCPDFGERNQKCKHVYAVECVVKRETGCDGSESVTKTLTLREKRTTYKQDWPAYNKAQTTEKARFQELLRDLCRGIVEPPPREGPGRRPASLADLIFSVAFKTYSTLSVRRFMTDLGDAAAKGHISRPQSFSAVTKAFENPELTPILRALIVESSKPLKSVEVDFAVDSSGFTSSRFVRWFDAKYGVVKQEYDWVKCHLMCGVKTNIVAAVEIGGRYAADSPQFVPLLNATSRSFKVNEVSADTAYSSYDNCDAVAALGGTPFIAFKSNATGAQGGTYEKMLHYYQFRRDEFLAHYHKRSNVESTNSMIKAKFGDHLRSKTDTAMVNESLCKVLCHNICVLIQSACELGITATFWADEEPTPFPAPQRATPPDVDDLVSMMVWI